MSGTGSDPSLRGDAASPDEQLVGQLLRIAGKRRAVPTDRTNRVREAVFAEWQRSLAEDRRRRATKRWAWSLAAAATVIMGLTLTSWRFGLGPWAPQLPTATVESVVAAVRLEGGTGRGASSSGELARPGMTVFGGERFDTGSSGLIAVRLASGQSVRLDNDTLLRVTSSDELLLERGAVYIDTVGAADGRNQLTVRTAFGTARDVGTQFAVRVSDDSVRVKVREGIVELDHAAGIEQAAAGSEIELDSKGEIRRRSIPLHGADWDWVARITPTIDLDGRTLGEFLRWVSRETGLRVLYLDASTHRRTEGIVLSGAIAELTPTEALAAVLPTCGLDHRIDDGTIVLEARDAGQGRRP
jgi:ferric-dicitrate binding protein FerR (iron transport regulator)